MKKFFRMFTHPTPREIAQRDLELAERSLISDQAAEEYYRHMAIYNAQRIARLKEFLEQQQ